LLALRALRESFPTELARVLRTSLNGVQQALIGLERDGLVVARTLGRTRLYVLNLRYFALKELERYLDRLLTVEPEIVDAAARIRRRPRRTGKPL
jgi:hypothetical protein